MRDGLLHEGVEAFLRIRRFQLLLDLARDSFGLAVPHAVIGELALFDQYGAGHIRYRLREPGGEGDALLARAGLDADLDRDAAEHLHEYLRFPEVRAGILILQVEVCA
ncbi:hypothetical protein D3C85_1532760 [compost metagenome]